MQFSPDSLDTRLTLYDLSEQQRPVDAVNVSRYLLISG
jgi:hypothetical protein